MVSPAPAEDLEALLAEALAKFDEGGESAMAAFVAAHPQQATRLERAIRRCRDMGLLGSAAGPDAHPERLGEFRLLRRIGSGGMGVVYEAMQEPLGRRVALKVIRPELLYFEGARDRFRREVDAIAALAHPAIVPILASGEHDGVPYYAMEFVEGCTVEQACAAQAGRAPAELRGNDLLACMPPGVDSSGELFADGWWQAAVRIGHQVALGLRHAHLRGIVHRDIKPSNVIVTPHGQAVVLDFGVAQVRAGQELTRSGATPGSPAFMSPEQRGGQATDERTDVFSLAATLWQMLTLRRPFTIAADGSVTGVLPPLLRTNRSAPRELDLVLRTAMDPDRERRHRDMAAFAADLQAVLDRRPIAARPLGVGLRCVRWCQRHRVAATALAALVLGAAAVLGVVVVQREAAAAALREEQARTRHSLETSLDALHTILVRLGNEQLRNVPLAERIAHGALEDAAVLYREILARHPENARARMQGGRALHALSMSFERQGDVEKSLLVVREAIDLLGTHAEGPAGLVDVRAHAWMSLGSYLSDTPDKDGARAALDGAERDFLALAATPGFRAESLRARANLRTIRSELEDERRDPQARESLLREAVALQRACLQLGDVDAKDPCLLVTHLCNLGKFLYRQDRLEEARAVFEEAVEPARNLPDGAFWPPGSIVAAELQEALGNVLARQQDPAAEACLRQSLAARERALQQFPGNLAFRMQLGGTLHNLGVYLFRQRDRTEDALALFQRARDRQAEVLARAPRSKQGLDFMGKHWTMIGRCQVLLRRGEDLAVTAAALGELPVDDPLLAVRAAEFLVQSAALRGEAGAASLQAALDQLLVAERRGLPAKELEAKVFDPLRGLPAFAALRERLLAPK